MLSTSVRLSVISRSTSKTAKRRITQTTPDDSPGKLVSPQGIAMPKPWLIFYPYGHFFRRLISEVTERISTKLGHIFIYDCCFKNLVRTPMGICPPRADGKKTAFLGPTFWTLTEHISATEHDINNRKESCQSTGTLPHPQIWWNLVSRNGWEWLASFCPAPKFSHWETLPALPHERCITNSRPTSARVM